MAVIKAEQAPLSQLGQFSMADIERQARAMLNNAKSRADRLLVEAQEAAEDLKKQAHAQALVQGQKDGMIKGLEDGRKAGREEALNEQRTELSQLLAALMEGVAQIEGNRIEIESAARLAVVRLAIAIAERITKRQGVLDENVALENIDEALRMVVHGADVRIAVHPSQRAMLSEVLPRIQMKWPSLKHVELVADGTLSPGGCRVFSGQGQIDGDLDLQLERIARELLPTVEDAT